MSGRYPPASPPAGQPRSALPASPRMKGNFQGRRWESTRRAPAEPLAGEAGQGCGAAATCPRRGHSPAAFVLPAAAPRGGRAGPGVAAPPRPWLPRQCRRLAPRCRPCPHQPGRGYGRGSLPGRLRSSAGHAGSWEARKRRGLRGFGCQTVRGGGGAPGCGTEGRGAALPFRYHPLWAGRPWRSGPPTWEGGRESSGRSRTRLGLAPGWSCSPSRIFPTQ